MAGIKIGVARLTVSSSARHQGARSSLLRLAAPRRMPRQAVALKKYRCGTSPVSKTSDNEHTAASLGHCEIPSVQHSVGEPLSVDVREPEAFADSEAALQVFKVAARIHHDRELRISKSLDTIGMKPSVIKRAI